MISSILLYIKNNTLDLVGLLVSGLVLWRTWKIRDILAYNDSVDSFNTKKNEISQKAEKAAKYIHEEYLSHSKDVYPHEDAYIFVYTEELIRSLTSYKKLLKRNGWRYVVEERKLLSTIYEKVFKKNKTFSLQKCMSISRKMEITHEEMLGIYRAISEIIEVNNIKGVRKHE